MRNVKKIVVKEQTTTGGAVVNAGGHVDLAAGMYDRPAKTDTTKPIVPSEMIATQLATNRPPIDDEEYVPTSNNELCYAVAEISKSVPADQIKKYFKHVKDYAQKCVNGEEDKVPNKNTMQSTTNESVKRKIKRMINEILSSFDDDDNEEEVIDTEPAVPLEDVAKHFGFKGASGARQYIMGIQDTLKKFVETVQPEDLERLQSFAVGEYIDLLESEEYIDPDDAEEMRKNPSMVEDLDSFRYFFNAAFVLPVTKKQAKMKQKAVYTAVIEMGAPVHLAQTIYNQVLGYAKKDPARIKARFEEAVAAGEITKEKADLVYSELMSRYSRLEKLANPKNEDVVESSLSWYQSTSIAARAKLLRQALTSTQEDIEGKTKYA